MAKDLLRIYGSKISANGKYLNITLVRGEKGQEEFLYTSVVLQPHMNNSKTFACIDEVENKAVVYVPLFKDKPKEKEVDEIDDLPF